MPPTGEAGEIVVGVTASVGRFGGIVLEGGTPLGLLEVVVGDTFCAGAEHADPTIVTAAVTSTADTERTRIPANSRS